MIPRWITGVLLHAVILLRPVSMIIVCQGETISPSFTRPRSLIITTITRIYSGPVRAGWMQNAIPAVSILSASGSLPTLADHACAITKYLFTALMCKEITTGAFLPAILNRQTETDVLIIPSAGMIITCLNVERQIIPGALTGEMAMI
jgi:hypothetical protein